MGNFYTNITLKGPTQRQVAEAMAGRTAFISPTVEGSTIVFDQQCEEQLTPELATLAAQLSEHFRCPALAAMNHDDDILWLQFFQNGSSPGGEYVSAPGYFVGQDMPPAGGDAGAIAAGFGMPDAAHEVERVLHEGRGEDGYIFAMQRHSDLLQALKLPEFASAAGFTYLSEGEFPDGLNESDFIRVV